MRSQDEPEKHPLAVSESRKDPRRTDQAWTIVGTVSTIWSIFLALILAFFDNIHSWIIHNSSWFAPFILVVLVILALVGGYLVRGIVRKDQIVLGLNLSEDGVLRPIFANIDAVLAKEAQARVIWIVSPRLFYDIYDPDFRKVILGNKARNATYRYIVPDSPEVRQNLLTYRELYHETEEQQMQNFLLLQDTGFAEFLTEIAIYDPGEPTMYAYAVPPSSRSGREDVMILQREIRHHFAKAFSDIWFAAKDGLP